jgi:hypothetical protein
MPNQKNNTEGSVKPTLVDEIRQPVPASAQSSGGEQGVFASSSTLNGPETLLDIDGLLKIAELISSIRRDGRFRGADKELSDHTNE